MSLDVLAKVERGERALDVDDLVAFALAFDVTPNDLLLPPPDHDESVMLTPLRRVPNRDAWAWATSLQDAVEAAAAQTLPHKDSIEQIGALLHQIEAAGGPRLRAIVPALEWSAREAAKRDGSR